MDSEGSNETIVKMSSTPENKGAEPVRTLESSRKNSKGDKLRKKDDKSVEQVLKALNSLQTTEEKLAAMCKKYADIVDENRKLQLAAKQGEKRCCVLQREKEQLQTEHSKAVLSHSRLESLCRELQRQNKAIKEESLQKVREEEEKRKEVSTKFQGTLNEITTLMQQNIEKNSKLKEENVEMAQRFGKLLEQYEIREQQVEKLVEQIHIETELGEARIAKARMEMASEKETMLREKQALLVELEQCKREIRGFQENDLRLRGQLNLYTDKYDEFKTALTRSSEVFNGFKGEMEKMSKKICKLEKETTSWKQRWECSHQALLEMAADKQQRDGELALANRRLTQMQALCRTLQAERAALLAQLRAGGEGVKDMDKGDESTKKPDDSKEVEETVPKEVIEPAKGPSEKESDLGTDGTSVEANKGTSALSSTSKVDEVKEVIGQISVDGSEYKTPKTQGSPSELEDGISQAVSVNPDDSVITAVPATSEEKGEDICASGNSDENTSKESESVPVIGNNVPLLKDMKNFKSANDDLLDESSLNVVGLPNELLLLPTVTEGEAANGVESTDFGVEKESIMEELNSLKEKLDSCVMSDIRPPAIQSDDKVIVIDLATDKLEEYKTQLEIAQDLSILCPSNNVPSKGPCNSISAAEPVAKELQCENICDISAGISTDMKTLSLDVCDTRTALAADGTTQDKKASEKIIDDSCTSAELTNVDGENAINSQEKCQESNVSADEKPVAKNTTPNSAAKKPDVQVNQKKGKESSRKRKR